MKSARFLLPAAVAFLASLAPAHAQKPFVLKDTVPPPAYPVQPLTKLGSSVALGTVTLNNVVTDYYVSVGAPYHDVVGVEDAGLVKNYFGSTGEARFVLRSPNPHPGDLFGYAIAGDLALVAIGTPGDDTSAVDAGIVYGFTISPSPPSSTTVRVTLHNPSPHAGDHFGAAVAVYVDSQNASRIAVGAPHDDTGAADAGRVYVFDPDSLTPDTPLTTLSHPNPVAGDQFGTSVDIFGSLVVVGASFADAGGTDSGVAYVFNLAGGTPTVPIAVINNPSPAQQDHFGASVAIDGTRVIVGAPGDQTGAVGAGAAYVYDVSSGTSAVLVHTLLNPAPAASEHFGHALAISGARVVVGAISDDTGADGAGSAYVFDLGSGTPTVPLALNNPAPNNGDGFGAAVGVLGTRVVAGAPGDDTIAEDAGGAYFYDVAGGTPATPVSTINDPSQSLFDQFGRSVAVSGQWLVVGATGEDSGANDAGTVYVFDLSSATPLLPAFTFRNPSPTTNGNFGYCVSVSGNRVAVGAQGHAVQIGGAYIYDLASASPTVPEFTLDNPDPNAGDAFGFDIAMDGRWVAVTAQNGDVSGTDSGGVHVYDLDRNTPTVPVLNLANPGGFDAFASFGGSIDLSGSRLVVGDVSDDTGATNAGRVFIYDLAGASPSVPLILSSPAPVSSNDQFGADVSISGDLLVVGARGKDVGFSNSGSAYVYDLGSVTPTTPARVLNNPFPASGDSFGSSVSISGLRVLVAAPSDDTGASNSGCVYHYDLSSVTPTVPIATLNNPLPAANAVFGGFLEVDGDVLAIGASFTSTFGLGDGAAFLYTPGRIFAREVLAVAAPKGQGSQVSGEPTGTTFMTLGGPATEGQERGTAFQTTLRDSAGETVKAIYADGAGVVARVKQTAPGAGGIATFKSFGDPLVSEQGLAFAAKLSDGRSGIWTTAFGNGLEPVLISGAAAPGITDSKIASVTSFSLRGEEIVALLKLKAGAGGVSAANDTVLVRSDAASDTLLLQESEPLTVDGTASAIKKLSIFTPVKLAPGQGRSHAEGVVALNVTLADGRIVSLALDEIGGRHIVAYNRSADGVLKIYSLFGLPCAGALDAIALKGFPVGALKSADEFTLVDRPVQETPDIPSDLGEGAAAPGGGGALFGVKSDPLINDDRIHAFIAKLTGPKELKLTGKNNTGLYWGRAGSIALAARLGGFAPDKNGQATSAQFASFKSFGLPDGSDAGPVFLTKLTGPKGSGVTGKNNQALYGVDSTGQLRELLRTDQPLDFNGVSKKVKSFTTLTGGLPVGGRRAFTTAGVFTARVTFTDNSTAIVRLEIP